MAKSAHLPLSGDIEAEIGALEELRARALVSGDHGVIDDLTANSYTHIDWNGTVQNKGEFLSDLMLRTISFDLFEIVENQITVNGGTAFAAGTYFNIVRENGIRLPPKYLRHLRIYFFEESTWRLVAHQATEAPLRL